MFKYFLRFNYLLSIYILIISISCNHQKSKNNNINKTQNALTKISYAKGFDIKYYTDYKEIQVIDYKSKNNKIIAKYFLVDKNQNIPEILKNEHIIRTPVERVICLSTTHIAFIDMINKTNTIIGVSGNNLVNNKKVCEMIKQNKIVDVGYDNDLNYELILSMKPDLVIAYNILGETSNNINKLQELGINVVINAEYLENIPLAKTEWVKFVAAFYNEDELSDNKFNNVVKEYNYYKSFSDTIKNKPSVITGLPWKNIWYIAGRNTNIANFIKDAGGDYFYKENLSLTIIPSSIEAVYNSFHNADIWINCGTANSIADIKANDERLQNFKPYKNGEIYNNNAILNANGGNDYWESGITNPQIILKDMISIFHPSLMPNHKLAYYKKLN